MKTAILLALLLLSTPLARLRAERPARENPYDLFGKTIQPFVALFSKNAPDARHALTADLRVVDSSRAELAGQTVHLAVESPNRLRLSASVMGAPVTLCRDGQALWAAPGAQIEALLALAGELPKPPKKYRLKDFELPIPEKQLVFLPVLFQVADAGDASLGGETCRVLDAKLTPELARSLGAENWTLRLWVRPNRQPAQLEVAGPEFRVRLAVDALGFAVVLPAATWQPAPGETDVMRLTPVRYKQLLDALTEAATQ